MSRVEGVLILIKEAIEGRAGKSFGNNAQIKRHMNDAWIREFNEMKGMTDVRIKAPLYQDKLYPKIEKGMRVGSDPWWWWQTKMGIIQTMYIGGYAYGNIQDRITWHNPDIRFLWDRAQVVNKSEIGCQAQDQVGHKINQNETIDWNCENSKNQDQEELESEIREIELITEDVERQELLPLSLITAANRLDMGLPPDLEFSKDPETKLDELIREVIELNSEEHLVKNQRDKSIEDIINQVITSNMVYKTVVNYRDDLENPEDDQVRKPDWELTGSTLVTLEDFQSDQHNMRTQSVLTNTLEVLELDRTWDILNTHEVSGMDRSQDTANTHEDQKGGLEDDRFKDILKENCRLEKRYQTGTEDPRNQRKELKPDCTEDQEDRKSWKGEEGLNLNPYRSQDQTEETNNGLTRMGGKSCLACNSQDSLFHKMWECPVLRENYPPSELSLISEPMIWKHNGLETPQLAETWLFSQSRSFEERCIIGGFVHKCVAHSRKFAEICNALGRQRLDTHKHFSY